MGVIGLFWEKLGTAGRVSCKIQLYNYISIAFSTDILFSVPVLTLSSSGMASVTSWTLFIIFSNVRF